MYLRQLVGFLIRASGDHRVGPHHAELNSTLPALVYQWGKSPVAIIPVQLRQVAKIGRTTYHKCMRQFETYRYIKYIASYSPVMGSLVYLEEWG